MNKKAHRFKRRSILQAIVYLTEAGKDAQYHHDTPVNEIKNEMMEHIEDHGGGEALEVTKHLLKKARQHHTAKKRPKPPFKDTNYLVTAASFAFSLPEMDD